MINMFRGFPFGGGIFINLGENEVVDVDYEDLTETPEPEEEVVEDLTGEDLED